MTTSFTKISLGSTTVVVGQRSDEDFATGAAAAEGTSDFFAQDATGQRQLRPELLAGDAVDQEPDGGVESHEEAGQVAEHDGPDGRVEALGVLGRVGRVNVVGVVPVEHVLEFDDVEDSARDAEHHEDDDDAEQYPAMPESVYILVNSVHYN